MEQQVHKFSELFMQLGLPSEHAAIESFIRLNRPLDLNTALVDATFWTDIQRDFLREAIDSDADWSYLVDELDECLRE